MQEDFPDDSASSITSEQAEQWSKGLITEERSAGTVRGVWMSAARRVFGWAVKEKLITRNPFKEVHITVPKMVQLRSKYFYPDEIRTIFEGCISDYRYP